MVYQARVLKDQVQHERQFFKYHLSRGVKTPRGLSPLGNSHFEYLYNILSMNPKSRVSLGIQIGQAKRTLADLNADLEEE